MAARPTVHNLWKRHRKQRQSDPESREISEVLTITSVKPIVTKYNQKFPSGLSYKNECSPSNRTPNQACPDHVNDSLAILQNKNFPQDSNETDSKNPQNCTHAESRVVNSFNSRKLTAQPCSVFKQDRPNASKTSPSTGSSINSVNNPVLHTGQRPTTLSCAGFKVLALHRLARQGQKLVKRSEASAVVSRRSTTETVSSMTIRNVPLSNVANTKPTATVRMMTVDSHRPAEMPDQRDISVQGSSAVCITNQLTSSARHGGVANNPAHTTSSGGVANNPAHTTSSGGVANNPAHTTSSGKEAGHKSASKSCLSFKNSSDMDARKYCVNLTSLMHSQPETHNPRNGHDVNITGDSTNGLQNSEKHSLHTCLPSIREVPSQLPGSDCTSNLADIDTLLTVKTDKEADLEAMEKAPEDHVAVTKTHGSATPTGSQQEARGKPLNIRGSVSACALGIPNQSERVSTTGAEVKTIRANQEHSKSIITPKNSEKVLENSAHMQNITENFLKDKHVSGSAVDTTTVQIKTDDNTDNPDKVMMCTVKPGQPDSSSDFTENVSTKCIRISVATSAPFSTNCSGSKHGDANRMQKKHSTMCSGSKTNPRSFTNKEDITTVLAHVPDSAGNAVEKENVQVLGDADNIQNECSTTYSSHSKTNSRSLTNKRHTSTVLAHVPDSPEKAVKDENVKVRTHSAEPSAENVNVELTEPQVTPNKTTLSSTERDTFTHVRCTANHVCVDYSKKDDNQKRDTRNRASLENKNTNKQQSVKKRNISKNITGFEDAALKESDSNEVPEILLDSSSRVVERGCKPKDQYNPEHSSEKSVNIKHESTKPDDLNETVSNTLEIKDSSAKAKVLDGVGDKGHEKENGFDVNEKLEQPDVNSSTKDSEDTETKGHVSGRSSAGPSAVKAFDCDYPAFTQTVADRKELECKVMPCEGPSSHQGISLRGKENAGTASRPVALKFPNEEMKSENGRMICSSSDCFQNSRAKVSTADTENRNESHQQNKTSVQKTQTSTSEHQQHTGPERVTPTSTTVKKDSPKSKHAQPKTKPNRSQILVSKQTDSVYSQKLPRTRGKNQTAAKHKEDSQENFAAAWPRVQSAQPQVFRAAARGTNKLDHPRSKSVMDMAGDKEPASRCHCQRRLPGSDRVSCHCSQALEESSDASGPRTDLDRQVKWFRMLWDQCCSQNTLDKALNVLKQMPREHRQQLVREVDSQNTCSMLMTCSVAGHLQMVDFLLDECSVDLDWSERYHDTRSPFGPSVHDQVTALWVAAVEGQLDIVQTLVRHGADIHAKSANGSSAVRSACYRLQVEVVEVLLKAGADVHSPNVDGVTCLMNGCNSPELCHLLLRHGARPKDRDVSGNTALHYAAAVGQLDSLRLLQQFGGNVMERNGAGNTVLRCAALRGWLHIVESLAQGCGSLSMVEIIEAYELAGSALVDLDIEGEGEGEGGVQCYQAGVLAWQKALQLRHISGLPKSRLRQEKIAPFQFRLEFSSQAELERIAADRLEGRIHALLVKERICGPQTEELIEAVMSRGEMCLEAGLYRSCIDLWMHAFRLLLDPSRSLGTASNYSPRRLLKLFLDLSEHGGTDAEEQGILQPSDTLAVLQLLVQFLNHALKPRNSSSSVLNEASSSKVQHEPSVDAELGTYLLHLQMSLHLIRIISTFQELLPGDLQRFHQMVYSLVKADHRSSSGDSLLHLCFRLSELEPGREESRLPTVQLLEILLQCGAEVDAVNHLGETPLFYIFTRRRPSPGRGRGSSGGAGDFFSWADKESWAQVLLRRQAHADRRTPGGRGVLRSLKRLDGFCLLSHVSLQCLAARVVRDCRLPYRDPELLPAHLISFVDIH